MPHPSMRSLDVRPLQFTVLHACPTCHGGAVHLHDSSKNDWVDYFRCKGCGHVWAVGKPDGSLHHIN